MYPIYELQELVAHRIARYVNIKERENIIAGRDYGYGYRAYPDIAWAKMQTVAAGASLATRHEHEWAVFEEVKLPDGKCLLPGVFDSTTNFIEHPQLLAQRLVRYAALVRREP